VSEWSAFELHCDHVPRGKTGCDRSSNRLILAAAH